MMAVAVVCIDCDQTWDREVKRGRPQLKCPECRAVPVIPVRAEAPLPTSSSDPTIKLWVASYKNNQNDETMIGVFSTKAAAQDAVDDVYGNWNWPGFVDRWDLNHAYIRSEAANAVAGVDDRKAVLVLWP